MADKWTYQIIPVYLADKVADVVGTRTDALVTPPDVRSFRLPLVSFATSPGVTLADIRDRIATKMIALYAEDKDRTDQEAAIRNQEALLAAATNAKEAP